MASQEELERVFQELAKEGRLQLVISVLQERYRNARDKLGTHLRTNLLSSEESKAEAYALQGEMRARAEDISVLRTIGGLNPPPPDRDS